jgi:hypothetical protein
MHYFDTSKDILNISISAAVISIAFFLCWLLLYAALSFRQFFKVVKDGQEMVNDLGKIVKGIREKTENFNAFFMLMGEGIKKLIEFTKDKEIKRRKRKEEKKDDAE